MVLPNALGELLTPSAVSVDDDGDRIWSVRPRAREPARIPERRALAFKRDMGTDRAYELGGKSFTPQELSALVLATLKARRRGRARPADRRSGGHGARLLRRAAAPGHARRRRARRAQGRAHHQRADRRRAGLRPARARRARCAAVVLDLGGGTFDVTVLEIIEGVIEIQASAGDTRLGGEDFTRRSSRRCSAAAAERARRRSRARRRWRGRGCAKPARSPSGACPSAERALVALPELQTAKGALRRRARRSSARPSTRCGRRCSSACARRSAARCATPAQSPGDIDEVLLVGGATRMPCVARLAAQLFGALPLRTLPPDEAVALGAAVQAALKAGDRSGRATWS